ncbi:MAG TPA: PAS domain S-box protein [Anaerolineales bacterium]
MSDEIPVKEETGGQATEGQKTSNGKGNHHNPRPRPNAGRLIPPDLTPEDALLRQEAFYSLTRLIAESNNDIDLLAGSVARLTAQVIGDLSVVLLVRGHGETYHVAAFHDEDPVASSLFQEALNNLSDIPVDQGWAAQVVGTGKPMILPPMPVDELNKHAFPAFTDFNRQLGIAGALIVPMAGRSGVIGVLALSRHAGGRAYTEADQAFLSEIGYRVALAIENAMLIESLRGENSARRFAREALIASEERFLSIFRTTTLGIMVMDLVGTMLETNPALQFMLGYDEDQLIALHFYDLVHPDDFARVLGGFNGLKTSRDSHLRLEHRMVSKDGSTIWVRTTFAAVKKGPRDNALSLIFGIVENISDRKQADAELLELKQHLQHSIELERLRIAQNLHDIPLQELYAVIYKLEGLRLKTDPAQAGALAETIEDIRNTLGSLRNTASELRPPALSRFGFEKAVRSYAQDLRERHPEIELRLSLARDRQMLPEEVRLVLFRIFQEAMNNIFRHAQATEVEVRFSFDAEEARLEVCDNGRGFSVPDNWMTLVRSGHYGLAGMAERVQAAGGVLTLESSAGATTLRAVVPCVG